MRRNTLHVHVHVVVTGRDKCMQQRSPSYTSAREHTSGAFNHLQLVTPGYTSQQGALRHVCLREQSS